MDALEAILTRKSVRSFTDREISDKDMDTILKSAMAGPSCANTKDWAFIVARDRELINKMAEANIMYSEPLRGASAGILVCGDLSRSYKNAQDYWIIDCSIAAQNISIAAHALGLGSVWLGVYPQAERVANQAKLFNLPEHIVPHSIIALGYADENATKTAKKSVYEEDRVHFEKW